MVTLSSTTRSLSELSKASDESSNVSTSDRELNQLVDRSSPIEILNVNAARQKAYRVMAAHYQPLLSTPPLLHSNVPPSQR